MCSVCLTVPTMPLKFTLENVTGEPNHLLASWMEPRPLYGVITSYSLTCSLSSHQVDCILLIVL